MSRAGAILLAAGGSKRLGRPKQLLTIDGESLLRRAARALVASTARPIVVVLGAAAEECAAQLDGLAVDQIHNPGWTEGIASSIRTGLAALQKLDLAVEAAVIVLCDQPFVTSQLIDRLIDRRLETGSVALACAYRGIAGVPAVFDRCCFEELLALTGDRGAQSVIAQHANLAASLPFPEGARDIDSPEDWSKLTGDRLP